MVPISGNDVEEDDDDADDDKECLVVLGSFVCGNERQTFLDDVETTVVVVDVVSFRSEEE